jgi:hypothetical protein
LKHSSNLEEADEPKVKDVSADDVEGQSDNEGSDWEEGQENSKRDAEGGKQEDHAEAVVLPSTPLQNSKESLEEAKAGEDRRVFAAPSFEVLKHKPSSSTHSSQHRIPTPMPPSRHSHASSPSLTPLNRQPELDRPVVSDQQRPVVDKSKDELAEPKEVESMSAQAKRLIEGRDPLPWTTSTKIQSGRKSPPGSKDQGLDKKDVGMEHTAVSAFLGSPARSPMRSQEEALSQAPPLTGSQHQTNEFSQNFPEAIDDRSPEANSTASEEYKTTRSGSESPQASLAMAVEEGSEPPVERASPKRNSRSPMIRRRRQSSSQRSRKRKLSRSPSSTSSRPSSKRLKLP